MEKALTISKIEGDKFPFNPIKLNLKKLIYENIDKISPAYPHQNEIIVNFNIESEEIFTDENLLNLIISNLISNAFKFVSTMTHPQVEVNKHNNEVTLKFQNFGALIPQEELNNIFRPFYRGPNVGATIGFSLGLSIVEKYVVSHHGSIEVVSTETDGTILTVRLPNAF